MQKQQVQQYMHRHLPGFEHPKKGEFHYLNATISSFFAAGILP